MEMFFGHFIFLVKTCLHQEKSYESGCQLLMQLRFLSESLMSGACKMLIPSQRFISRKNIECNSVGISK